MPNLPTEIYLNDLNINDNQPLSFNIGIVDDPANQAQSPVSLYLPHVEHTFISGTTGSGKTSLLQTMLYSFAQSSTPEQLNIYIANYGSRTLGVFAKLPHTGGVVFDDQQDRTNKISLLLIKELDRRKRLFVKKGAGTYS